MFGDPYGNSFVNRIHEIWLCENGGPLAIQKSVSATCAIETKKMTAKLRVA